MTPAAMTLARFAQGLRFEEIPAPVLQRAIACIGDTVACSVYGSQFPWSAITARLAQSYGGGSECTLFGVDGVAVSAPCAALANGASAHAFEQDSLRFPRRRGAPRCDARTGAGRRVPGNRRDRQGRAHCIRGRMRSSVSRRRRHAPQQREARFPRPG